MNINILDLIKNKVTSQEIEISFEGGKLWGEDKEFNFSKPIKLHATLSSAGDIITLDGTYETELKLVCSRCITDFVYPVAAEIHEKLSNNPENKDEDIIFIDSDTLDITEIVENNIVTSLPIKKLCKEECKGLCQQCGIDLNHESCKCNQNEIDPRLAKLKELFLTD